MVEYAIITLKSYRTLALSSTPRPLILNNSSFAALSLPNNDRYLFYQGYDGIVRQAFYATQPRKWTSTGSVSSNAKNHTPLAAINVVGEINAGDHTLAAAKFSTGSWSQDPDFGPFMDLRTTALSPKSLAVTEIPKTSPRQVYLCYEDENTTVTILRGLFQVSLASVPNSVSSSIQSLYMMESSISLLQSSPIPTQTISETPIPNINMGTFEVTSGWDWQDISSSFTAASLLSRLGSPFSLYYDGQGVSAIFMDKNASNLETGAILSAKLSNTTSKICSSSLYLPEIRTDDGNLDHQPSVEIANANEIPSLLSLSIGPVNTGHPTNGTKTSQYTFWVDGATLRTTTANTTSDYNTRRINRITSAFPYPQLGGSAPLDGTVLYLYHQINETTFAEDQWDETTGVWTSQNITVSL
ncbi:MAG: hypothetical protein Q9167_004286 [Letrouitia subvulpina]